MICLLASPLGDCELLQSRPRLSTAGPGRPTEAAALSETLPSSPAAGDLRRRCPARAQAAARGKPPQEPGPCRASPPPQQPTRPGQGRSSPRRLPGGPGTHRPRIRVRGSLRAGAESQRERQGSPACRGARPKREASGSGSVTVCWVTWTSNYPSGSQFLPWQMRRTTAAPG